MERISFFTRLPVTTSVLTHRKFSSGIGGGIVAEQLADLGADVLLLEAGSYLFPTHIANLPGVR